MYTYGYKIASVFVQYLRIDGNNQNLWNTERLSMCNRDLRTSIVTNHVPAITTIERSDVIVSDYALRVQELELASRSY